MERIVFIKRDLMEIMRVPENRIMDLNVEKGVKSCESHK